MAATWKVTLKKDCYRASYSGDPYEALEKAKTDLKKYRSDKNIEKWVWLKEKAEAEIAANKRAIERAQIFIEIAEKELKKQEEENALKVIEGNYKNNGGVN